MLKRALALNHIITNLEVMSSEISVWNLTGLAEEKLARNIKDHAEEHGFVITQGSLQHIWRRTAKPSDMFILTTMATLEKEEVDMAQNAA